MEYLTIEEEKRDIIEMLKELSARGIHKVRVYAKTMLEIEQERR